MSVPPGGLTHDRTSEVALMTSEHSAHPHAEGLELMKQIIRVALRLHLVKRPGIWFPGRPPEVCDAGTLNQ